MQSLSKAQVRYTLAGVFVGLFLAALDQTIVATALPTITGELRGGPWYAWVTVSYLLLSTLSAPIFGHLTEIYSRKRVLLMAIGIFIGGSLLCALTPGVNPMPSSPSWGFWWLVVARGLQGVGGGALFALAFTTLAWLFPPRERSRWAGLIGAVFGLSAALGPPVGGALSEYFGWRWAFWINLPLGGLAILLIQRFMPILPPIQKVPLDKPGTLLLIVWGSAWLLSLSAFGPHPLLPSFGGGLLAGIGLLAFLLWLWVEHRTRSPLFDLSYIRVATFRHAVLAGFFFGPAFLGGVTFLPLYLQAILGQKPSESGFYLLILTVCSVLSTGMVGFWVSRHGRYKPLLVGSSAILLSVFWGAAAALPSQMSTVLLVGLLIIVGFVLGPLQALLSVVAQNDIPIQRVGTATSFVQFVRQMGSAWGLALLNGLFDYGLGSSASEAATVLSLQWAFGGMAALSVGLLGMTLLLPDRRLRQRRMEEEVLT